MSLTVGVRFGPYEVTGSLGAGGMGKVYRARDTELGREVALKVLPADVHADSERLARFQREAQVLKLFEKRLRDFDVASDGRFVAVVPDESAPPAPVNIVLNWFGELKRLVP